MLNRIPFVNRLKTIKGCYVWPNIQDSSKNNSTMNAHPRECATINLAELLLSIKEVMYLFKFTSISHLDSTGEVGEDSQSNSEITL